MESEVCVGRETWGPVKKMLEVASWLGVDTILVVPGAVDASFKPGFPVVS